MADSSLIPALRRKASAAVARPWRWREGGATEGWALPDQMIHYRLLDAAGRAALCHAQTWPIRDVEADLVIEAVNRFDAFLDLAKAVEDFLREEYPGGTDHPADEAADRLRRRLEAL